MLKGLKKNYLFRKAFNKAVGLPAVANTINRINTLAADKYIKNWGNNYPKLLHIENTNHCNAQCIMCPHKNMKRKKGTMDDSLFKKTLQQYRSIGGESVNIQAMGEPFLDKQFLTKVKIAKELGFFVRASTNGSLINRDVAKKLAILMIDELYISIDGFLKETFERVRVGLDYEEVTSNILHLSSHLKKNRLDRPKIILRYVGFDQNIKESKLFYKFWKEKVDEVLVTFAHSWSDGVTIEKSNINSIWKDIPCRILWEEMVVLWDGTAVACCHDYEGILKVGDVKKDSLKDIWKGKRFQALRDLHAQGRRRTIDFCRKCAVHSFWF